MTINPGVPPGDDAVEMVHIPVADSERGRSADPSPPVRGIPMAVASIGLVIALVAVIASAVVLRRERRVIVRTSVVVPAVTAAVDASGCPLDVSCDVLPDPERGLVDALRAVDLDGYGYSGSDVYEAATGKTFRTSVTVQLPARSILSVTSQCVPRGGVVPARRSVPDVGPADALVVVPGAPGCSVAVTAHVQPGVAVPGNLMDRIAGYSGAQLTG